MTQRDTPESHLRTRLESLLDGLLQCQQQGDAVSVHLGWESNIPVCSIELSQTLCKILDKPWNMSTIDYEDSGKRPYRFTTTEWSVGPWVCVAEHSLVVVRAKDQPSAHVILTATKVRDKLQTMNLTGLVDHVP